MHFKAVQKILGVMLTLFSLTLIPPLAISLWTQDGAGGAFTTGAMAILIAGFLIWLPVRNCRDELKLRDGFIVVVLFWSVLGVSGALPFVLADQPHLRFIDAVFESVSGLTTTGATVITAIDLLPPSVLFYRQQLQWLGGMGIIVLAIAILPMLGIGGMQFYRAETPGPMKDTKLTPRITETAKALWYIYLALTVVCSLAYFAAGMTPFDAIAHAFSTVAIGGFSTHDQSIGYYDSPVVEAICVVFMLLAGMNFSLHFLALRFRNFKPYFYDSELRFYLFLLAVVCASCIAGLLLSDTASGFPAAVRAGIFQAVSIGTTTGFTSAHYQGWPQALAILLLFASFIGGCAGSTAGGLKVVRVLLLCKQGLREILRLIHPHAVLSIKVGGRRVDDVVVEAVWGFFATYVLLFTALMLGIMATGLDQVTAFSAIAASINNVGPGLGAVSTHYADLPATAKSILVFAMLLGRLEIFTLIVVLTPAFWRS